jgi:hypothetical protein
MLYMAKCYWPGVTEVVLGDTPDRAHRRNDTDHAPVSRGLRYLRGDETTLALFEADVLGSVKQASESVGMPCEHVIATVWVAPDLKGGSKCSSDTCGGT